jgi:RNA polymerase sigma-70 factor (ECF subfamily)
VEAVCDDRSLPQSKRREVAWEKATADEWRCLFEGVAEGKVTDLERLYELAAERLYGLALWHTRSREDARDVVQDVFVRLAEQRDRLRRVRQPRAWLLTVAHRRAVDIVRKRRKRGVEAIDAASLLVAPSDDPDRVIEAGRLSRLLVKLPRPQREAIYLRHFADCSFAEIGRIVGAPTFTAASRYRLGISSLRRLIGGRDG